MILKKGRTLSFISGVDCQSVLEPINYLLKFNIHDNRYELEEAEPFSLPSKMYGDHSHIYRWKKSFEVNTKKNLGIILAGTKGSGKTLDAQKFCMEMKVPVIFITEPFNGPEFIDFITNPELGTCIIFIDEFEKIYNRDDQKSKDLLSLMDGNFTTNLIFLLTVNTLNLNDYLVNRLNRIKYLRSYDNLSKDVIENVIEDTLVNKDHKDSIFEFFKKIGIVTFDLLTNIIKEMNLFNEDALECAKHLNLKAEELHYTVLEEYKGKEYKQDSIYMSSQDASIDITRDNQSFIDPKDKKYCKDYMVEINFDSCNVERKESGVIIIHDTEKNLKFKLIPTSLKTTLIF